MSNNDGIYKFLGNPTKSVDDLLTSIENVKSHKYISAPKLNKELKHAYMIFDGMINKIFPLFSKEFLFWLFTEKIFSPEETILASDYLKRFTGLPRKQIHKNFSVYPPIEKALKTMRAFKLQFKVTYYFLRMRLLMFKIFYFTLLFIFGLGAAIVIEGIINYFNIEQFLLNQFSIDTIYYIKISISFVIAKYCADLIEEKIADYFLQQRFDNNIKRLKKLSQQFNFDYDKTWSDLKIDRQQFVTYFIEYNEMILGKN